MNTVTLSKSNSLSKSTLVIALLIIFYTVGILTLSFGWYEDIIQFTPAQLLGSLALVLWCHESWNMRMVWVLGFIYLAGLGVEIAGVQTGLLFGDYHYGEVFGPQIAGTPLLIGVNWVMLIYCSSVVVNRLAEAWPIWMKALAGAAIMTSLDVLIEPVAMRYDFWDWAGGVIPLQNYVMWFVISFLLLLVFHKAVHPKYNQTALVLLCLQFVFFGILNF